RFSIRLTSPRAPLSRIHSTNRIPTLEFDGWRIALASDTAAGIRLISAAIIRIRRTRCHPRGPTGTVGGGVRERARGAGAGALEGASTESEVVLCAAGEPKEMLKGSSCDRQLLLRNRANVTDDA